MRNALIFLALLSGAALAQDWKEQATSAGLDEAAIGRLGEQKVLVSGESLLQVFSAYIGSPAPVFVTTDSILNGYHVLFEESVRRLEMAHARALPKVLRRLWDGACGPREDLRLEQALVEAARQRALVTVGTALALLGEPTPDASDAQAKLIAEERARVERAEGRSKPEWLGPPDAGFRALDYSRFRPRGFYAGDELLERYFRAVSWLQAIPFRVERDEELLSFLLLAKALDFDDEDYELVEECKSILEGMTELVGPGDDLGFEDAHRTSISPIDTEGLGYLRCSYLGDTPEIQDTVADGLPEVSFRILPAARTADGVLFHQLTIGRPWPDGLAVAALLGSGFARGRIDEPVREIVDACTGRLDEQSLYAQYLRCLSALFDDPEPDAPEFLRGGTWAVKSCQAGLAGWAQLRHTWALQAKQVEFTLGAAPTPAGFVEPDPGFFAELRRLTRATMDVLDSAGAFGTEFNRADLAGQVRRFLKLVPRIDISKEEHDERYRGFTREEFQLVSMMHAVAYELGVREDDEKPEESHAQAIAKLRELLAELDAADRPLRPEVARLVQAASFDVREMWRFLEQLCFHLETMAHKQLRGVAWDEEEEDFLREYGAHLAGVMFYGGNSYLRPNDDAPRIVDVYSNASEGLYLLVGIARARPLWVLYPWGGKEVLCVGGVLPYHEFRHGSRLMDHEWMGLLDGDERPERPAWLAGLYAE